MQADITCPYCSYRQIVVAQSARIDQSANGDLWQHLQAAHYNEVKAWRAMGMNERKVALAAHIAYSAETAVT